jgi:hypothetical protein
MVAGEGFDGRMDEVRVFGVVHTHVYDLDANVRIDAEKTTALTVHFAPGGWLDEAFHAEPVRIVLTSSTDANKEEVLEISRLGTLR